MTSAVHSRHTKGANLGTIPKALSKRGFAVFLTGLPCAGKSTTANALCDALSELTRRPVTLLDGEDAREILSSELSFSREDRDRHLCRVGFVASEIVRHGGICVCSAIAPYDAARRKVRSMVEAIGAFILVHVATPPEVCEARDSKGLYAQARAGAIAHFTGVSDPYEPPEDAEVIVDASTMSAAVACVHILDRLRNREYI